MTGHKYYVQVQALHLKFMPKCSVFRNAVVNCSNFKAVLFDKHQLTLRIERLIRRRVYDAEKF